MSRASRVRVNGPLAPFAMDFRRHLAEQGYRSGLGLMTLMSDVSRWLAGQRLNVGDLTDVSGMTS